MGKFDFDEMDSAMQNAESLQLYEQQTKLLKENTEVLNNLNENIHLFIETTECLTKNMRPMIEELDKASTIKCNPSLKEKMLVYSDEVCDHIKGKMNEEATEVLRRFTVVNSRKYISEFMFYSLVIIAIAHISLMTTLCFANLYIFHSHKLWQIIGVFCVSLAISISIPRYVLLDVYK